ncbi:MAG: mechanosensitive ion channel family protein [Nanoarchaeota archaeon]
MAFLEQARLILEQSLGRIIVVIIILSCTFILAKIVRSFMDRAAKRQRRLLKVDDTHFKFMKHALTAIIYIVGFGIAIYTIPAFRALSVSLLAGAGVLAVVIGFASQQAFSNIISGVFIVIFKPFRVGDRIRIGTDVSGIVEDINLRHTVIKTFENKRVIIPNSIISNEKIENAHLGDEEVCKFVEFSISYDSDIDKAFRLMQEEALKHPLTIDKRTSEEKKNKEPVVRTKVLGFGDSSVNLRAWVWAKDPADATMLGWDLNKAIKQRFDKEGIEIPFPYRTIVYKKVTSSEIE